MYGSKYFFLLSKKKKQKKSNDRPSKIPTKNVAQGSGTGDKLQNQRIRKFVTKQKKEPDAPQHGLSC